MHNAAEPEAGRGDAGDASRIGTAVGQRAIANQPGSRIGLVPEEQESAADNLFQQFVLI